MRLRPLDLTYRDGSTRVQELYHGSPYLSQSSRILAVPDGVASVRIVDFGGGTRPLTLGDERLAGRK